LSVPFFPYAKKLSTYSVIPTAQTIIERIVAVSPTWSYTLLLDDLYMIKEKTAKNSENTIGMLISTVRTVTTYVKVFSQTMLISSAPGCTKIPKGISIITIKRAITPKSNVLLMLSSCVILFSPFGQAVACSKRNCPFALSFIDRQSFKIHNKDRTCQGATGC